MAELAQFHNDRILLDSLPAERRAAFEKYMAELDEECAKRGHPYGEGSLWTNTGAQCWFDFFEDEMTAADALDEDMSND